jgi:hypothetical protein
MNCSWFHALRKFCEERGLSLSRHGHSVNCDGRFFQVFMFAEEEHAEIFRSAFGGERMHTSERGKGARWAQWKRQMSKSPKDSLKRIKGL